MIRYTSSGGPTFLGALKLNYYGGPFQSARTSNMVKRAENGWLGGVHDNWSYLDPFPTSIEVWVTDDIVFNVLFRRRLKKQN
jgi:hypothetical protein